MPFVISVLCPGTAIPHLESLVPTKVFSCAVVQIDVFGGRVRAGNSYATVLMHLFFSLFLFLGTFSILSKLCWILVINYLLFN